MLLLAAAACSFFFFIMASSSSSFVTAAADLLQCRGVCAIVNCLLLLLLPLSDLVGVWFNLLLLRELFVNASISSEAFRASATIAFGADSDDNEVLVVECFSVSTVCARWSFIMGGVGGTAFFFFVLLLLLLLPLFDDDTIIPCWFLFCATRKNDFMILYICCLIEE